MHTNAAATRGYLLLISSLSATLAGCAIPEKSETRPPDGAPAPWLTEDTRTILRREMSQFTEFAVSEITATAENIEAQTEDREVRRASLHWKLALVPEIHDSLDAEAPMRSLLDTWTFTVRLTQYFTAGEGQELFGDQQAQAIETAERLETAAENIARRHLPQDALPKVVQEIEDYARAHPIRGMFICDAADQFSTNVAVENRMMGILKMPMRFVNQGIQRLDPTMRLSLSVDRFTDLIEDYPALVRWQTQLLMLQLEDTATLKTALASMDNISTTSVELVATARALPREIRDQTTQLLEDFDNRQPQLRATLTEARTTIAEINAALKTSQDVLQNVQQTGDVLARTADAITATVQETQKLMPPSDRSAGPDQRPFDITEYTQTAEAIAAATTELRRALEEIRSLVRKDDGDAAPINRVSAAVVDHAAWRAAQVCGLIFGLALLYRLISLLLRRRLGREKPAH